MIQVWGAAGKEGGRVIARIEDHDRGRARPEYESTILENMEWLGFIPDQGIRASESGKPSAYRQSDCADEYAAVLRILESKGLVYGCACSRSDVRALQPPDRDELHYPGTCSEKNLPCAHWRRCSIRRSAHVPAAAPQPTYITVRPKSRPDRGDGLPACPNRPADRATGWQPVATIDVRYRQTRLLGRTLHYWLVCSSRRASTCITVSPVGSCRPGQGVSHRLGCPEGAWATASKKRPCSIVAHPPAGGCEGATSRLF